MDPDRGLDHGAYVPLVAMYPAADVPVLQVSMPGLDAPALYEFGRALAPLRDEGVLIVGSGMSFHNLRAFGSTDPRVIEAAQRFDDWLAAAVEEPDEAERSRALESWSAARTSRKRLVAAVKVQATVAKLPPRSCSETVGRSP